MTGIADHDRHDMAVVVQMRDADGVEPRARTLRDPLPMARALGAGLALRWRMLARAPAATAGGSAVVKMKPEAKLRTKSHSAAEPAI